MINELRFVASHYLALGLLTLVSYVFGRRLTRRIQYQSFLEQASFSVTLGLGVIAYLILLLGVLRLLYPSLLLLALLMGLAICYPVWSGWPRELRVLWRKSKASGKRRIVFSLGGAVIVVALSIPILALPLYPPTAFDSIMYHLTSAKIYAQEHQLVYTPYLRYPVLPQTNQMLFTGALLVYDDILAQLIELLMMITLLTAVIAFGQRYFTTRAGLWAAAILVGSPLVLWLGSVAYIDMGVTLFITTTIYAFWNWLESRQRYWLVLSAILCGLAVGTKSPPLFFLGILTIVALYVSFRERRYMPVGLFATVAILVAAPWFARSFYYTHNPVFPLFYEQFGHLFGFGHSQGEYYRGLLEALATTGINREPAPMLLWHLATTGGIPPESHSILGIPFLLLPISLVVSLRKIRVRGLLALFVAYLIFWLLTVRDLRFLVPALPLLSLMTAGTLVYLASKLPWIENVARSRAVTVLVLVLLAYPGWRYGVLRKNERGPLPATPEQRDTYLGQLLPSYSAHKLLNNLKGHGYTLYAMQDENLAYFVDGVYKGDYFGPARYARIWDKLNNGQLLYNELKVLDADYFLINQLRMRINLPQDSFFRSHFKPIVKTETIQLFEITDAVIERRISEILQNPDFESFENDRLVGWEFAGSPVVDRSGKYSFSGSVAVHCQRAGDVVYQTVVVNPGQHYLVSWEARSVAPSQTAKLQVDWTDAQGALVKEDISTVESGTEWKRYEIGLQAPAQATRAIVYASPLDPSSIWFDDVSFSQVEYKTSK